MSPKVKELVKEWIVPPKGEFRFEVSFEETIVLILKMGEAEIYGTELAPNREYELTGVKMAVFSYEGATISIRGLCEVEYVSEEVPTMPVYLNTHFAIENLSQKAAEVNDDAPRILVIGSSRHTVASILANYAIRSGKSPTLVELDTNRGMLLFPGTLTAQTLDSVIDVEEGIPESTARCSYFYGHQNPTDNIKLYMKQVTKLASSVNARFASRDDSTKSGAVIIAPADIGDHLTEIMDLFRVDVILVIGNERLHSTISRTITDASVLKLPLSGGVVRLDANFRRNMIQRQFKTYFYGPKHEYTPFSVALPFADVNLRRLGEDALAPSSALPLGATRKVSQTRTSKVEPSRLLLYSILGCSFANADEEDQLTESNCTGYVYVTAVDENKKLMTLLSPCPGKIPSTYLIVSSIKWLE